MHLIFKNIFYDKRYRCLELDFRLKSPITKIKEKFLLKEFEFVTLQQVLTQEFRRTTHSF